MSSPHAANDPLRRALQGFAVAPVEMLQQRALTTRNDFKFALPRNALQQLLEDLRHSHVVLLAGTETIAQYATQYYDTKSLKTYHDHLQQRPRRIKVRHRTYIDRDMAMFEVKRKNPRGRTSKLRLPARTGACRLTAAEKQLLRDHTALDPDTLRPSLRNYFRRITLLGVEEAERLTIDVDVRFGLGTSETSLPNLAIVEVKSRRPLGEARTAKHLIEHYARPGGISKYCLGTHMLLPDEPASRLAKLKHRLITTGAVPREVLHVA